MQIQDKIDGILYDRGGKPGSNYPNLAPGKELWNRVRVPCSDYKSLLYRPLSYCGHRIRLRNNCTWQQCRKDA